MERRDSRLRTPTCRSELAELLIVRSIRVGGDLALEHLPDDAAEDASDGMDSVVAIEPLHHESRQGSCHRSLAAEKDLILDNDVSRRMQPRVRQLDAVRSVEVEHQLDLLGLVEMLPVGGIGSALGIVILHATPRLSRAV